jgi:zeaxanthin glucosyltransferase
MRVHLRRRATKLSGQILPAQRVAATPGNSFVAAPLKCPALQSSLLLALDPAALATRPTRLLSRAARLGIVCPPIPGHLNPLATLGRTLQRRGHLVTVFQVPSLEVRARNEGLQFCGLGPDSGELADMIDRLGQLQGLSSLRFAVQGACRLANIICTYAPDAVRAAGIDLLLVDQNEPAGGSVAEHMGLPFVSVCPSLPLNREPGIPPPFVPWGYSPEWWARVRNRLGYALSDRLIAPIQKTLNGFRAAWGLRRLGTPDDSFSRLAQICQMPREFDFPREELPANFHYPGPFLEESGTSPTDSFPFDRLDGRPLVYASFGTLQSGAGDHFRRIAQACAPLGVQLVMATGGYRGEGPDFPGDPIVVGYAPQMALLRRASLTLTHGGMNTVMQSLACGVPMVAIPMAHDQPAIAARLARTGAGIVMAPQQASAERVRASIERVLADPQYRNAAALLRDAIVRSGGVERAADIVEHCLAESYAPGNH